MARGLTVAFDDVPIELRVVARSERASREGVICGLEFEPGQHVARARLALALFRTRIAPTADPAPADEEAATDVAVHATGPDVDGRAAA